MTVHRLVLALSLIRVALSGLAGLAGLAGLVGLASAEGVDRQAGRDPVVVIQVDGPIGPATARFISESLAEAEARSAQLLVLQMDTPGGLATSMREIIRDVLASEVPVATYVAPSGARAASAGTYILYASHVAAMAPGTNLGAATPVQIGGGLPAPPAPERSAPEGPAGGDASGSEPGREDATPAAPGGASAAKAVNDAVAYIRSLAQLRDRNVDWAERAVREAASLPASEALDLGVIDLTAETLEDLLQALDGREVTTPAGPRVLSTSDAPVARLEPGWLTQALGVLSNPNVAFLLMLLGVYGLIFEFMNPGTIGPGVIGAIALVIGLYALNQLPLSYAGMALILLGLAFMVAEALTPSVGILGLGGVVAFVIGAAFLIDTDVAAYRLSWWTIGLTGALSGGFFLWLLASLVQSRGHAISAGRERMLSEPATVLDWSDGHGHVRTQGEIWKARSDAALEPDQTVRILKIEGLELIVGPDR